MSTLEMKLDAIREGFESRAPEPALEVMHRATADLVSSGAADRALGEGAVAPAFTLPSAGGDIARSTELLAQGPLMLTFFRGHW